MDDLSDPTHDADEQDGPLPVVASATPSLLRETASAARIEVRSDLTLGATALAAQRDSDERSGRRKMPEGASCAAPAASTWSRTPCSGATGCA